MSAVLILAGTAEAREVATLLADCGDVSASLAGVTARPAAFPVPVRTGGFGGADGLGEWLVRHGTKAVIDATHPFAAQMPWNAEIACRRANIPRLRLLRPEWPAQPGWIPVASFAEAASVLPAGARVLLTTGHGGLDAFAARRDVSFTLRSIEDVGPLLAHITPLRARPPFRDADETALLARIGATHLVSRNAGGTGRAKLDSAAAAGVSVVMISRPAVPPGPVAENAVEAVAWLAGTVAKRS